MLTIPVVTCLLFSALADVRPVVYTADRPPEVIQRWIEQLTTRRGAAQDEAVAHLSRLNVAEPYIRALPPALDGLTRRQVTATLTALHNRACERALERHATGWARTGRVDMLVELACLTEDAKLAGQVANLTLATISKLRPDMTTPEPPLGRIPARMFPWDDYAKWSKMPYFLRVTDGELMTGSNYGNVFAHSLTFRTNVGDKNYWLCLVGDRLNESSSRPRDWWHSLVAVNNSAEFNNLHNSAVVIDGDVNLTQLHGYGLLSGSVIICRGSIRAKEKVSPGPSLLCAGGDITFEGRATLWPETHLYAGGRVIAGKGPLGKTNVHEKADVSFTGVRFFELSDIGVDAADVKGGVRITKVEPRSPLAFYGLRVGDVVTRLNDQPMTSVNEFRRHARRSVVLRSGIFHLRRGDKDLSRIVYFDGLLEPRK